MKEKLESLLQLQELVTNLPTQNFISSLDQVIIKLADCEPEDEFERFDLQVHIKNMKKMNKLFLKIQDYQLSNEG